MNPKNEYWQVIRAVCIIAVIAIHCPNALSEDNVGFQFHLYIASRALVNFPVAVFLFLSGYFVNQDKCLNDPKTYILNRGGVRLLIPYLIWSMIYIVASIIGGDQLGVSTIIWRLLAGKAAGPLYYIVVLIQLTLLTPLLLHVVNKKYYWMWLITPIALLMVYVFAFRAGSIPWYCDTLFPLWFGFYYLGIRLKAGDVHIELFLRKIGSIQYLLLAFVLNLAESELLINKQITSALSVSQNRIGGFIYALAIIGLFYKLSEKKQGKIKTLVWLGDNSYAIYFTHYLALKIVGKVMGNKLAEFWILNFGVTFISILLLTCAVIAAVKLIAIKIGKQKQLKYIGY